MSISKALLLVAGILILIGYVLARISYTEPGWFVLLLPAFVAVVAASLLD